MKSWYVYILNCADGSLYTWITNDLDRRVDEHNNSKKWAHYTKIKRPVELVWYLVCESRSIASKEEYRIKKMTRLQKVLLIQNFK